MRILIIGSGGREHALAWRLSESSSVQATFVLPGNAGIDLDPNIKRLRTTKKITNELVLEAIKANNVDLTIIGPEAFLVTGLVDFLRSKKMPVIGPSKAAAQLEGSKAFSKLFMRENSIKTAGFEIFVSYEKAIDYLKSREFPLVIKADGLAGGKGVFIVKSLSEGQSILSRLMIDDMLGLAGKKVVIEEFVSGFEISLIVLTDGKKIIRFPVCQDYKNLDDGGVGPNTGGMGVHFPLDFISDAMLKKFEDEIIFPALKGMEKSGHLYNGFLYCGLMVDKDGTANVLEFNCRLGDPETQLLMLLIRGDLGPVFESIGVFDTASLIQTKDNFWDKKPGLTVMASSAGYPGNYNSGELVTIQDELKENDYLKVFHSGTELNVNGLVTNGGRVLSVSGLGPDKVSARNMVYKAISRINFKGKHYRKDIGLLEARNSDQMTKKDKT